jgi:predicted NUDIX family NTP pyrophosphohydrolase
MPEISAGLLVYRPTGVRASPQVLLIHPGGPFWKGKDAGAWSIPKGLVEADEDFLPAARRETQEELGMCPWERVDRTAGHAEPAFIPLGSVKLKSGKVVHAWAVEGECDVAAVKSNTFPLQWPPKSGKWISVPEVDEAGWFGIQEAREKLNPAQGAFLDRLMDHLDAGG